ncbi:uncharacterized protein LOC121404963 [Drosophila obscura]|uniref:uncharacterized protein LOC121404963 n=1 Tax=Drosophila obscura TaxID=7282 RepID=UPI001BB28A54|nr:uncharacterized protein LOC121404963 [Drosophila obscura]
MGYCELESVQSQGAIGLLGCSYGVCLGSSRYGGETASIGRVAATVKQQVWRQGSSHDQQQASVQSQGAIGLLGCSYGVCLGSSRYGGETASIGRVAATVKQQVWRQGSSHDQQQAGEPFKEYMVEMQTLMRPLKCPQEEQTELKKENSMLDLGHTCGRIVPGFGCDDGVGRRSKRWRVIAWTSSERTPQLKHGRPSVQQAGGGRDMPTLQGRIDHTKGERNLAIGYAHNDKPYPERLCDTPGTGMWAVRKRRALVARIQCSASQILLEMRDGRKVNMGLLQEDGKRPATQAEKDRAGVAGDRPHDLVGRLTNEEIQLSAVVTIAGRELQATGSTSSFSSCELTDSTGIITRQLEVQMAFGNQEVALKVLILPGVIEVLIGRGGGDLCGAQCGDPRQRSESRRKGRETVSGDSGDLEHGYGTGSVGGGTQAEAAVLTLTGARPDEAPREESVETFPARKLKEFAKLKGVSNVATHTITMSDAQPVKQRYSPKNPKMQAEINRKVDELLELGCIEPSKSPYSSPIIMVKKKTCRWRLCVDFRQVNTKSVKDALDLKDGYWLIPLEEKSRQITAFTVPKKGLYQWKVMLFGLHSASAAFQRTLDQVIGPEMMLHAFAYQDDIIVIGRTEEEHRKNMEEVFRRLRKANLRLNADKCQFFRKESHKVTGEGVKELRQYLGVASWYRRFVPDFATLVQPLTALLKKKVSWEWNQERQEEFEAVKGRLVADPVLACLDFSQKFVLRTDASDYGLGAILTLETERGERVISYASRSLNGAERNYSATEKKCLALVWAVRRLKPYLEGYRFKVVTDLKWLNCIESPAWRVARSGIQERAAQRGRGRTFQAASDGMVPSNEEEEEGDDKAKRTPCKWMTGRGNALKRNP